MPQIKFTDEKADRWIRRIEKRESKLSPENLILFRSIRAVRASGGKLDHPMELALFQLERLVS